MTLPKISILHLMYGILLLIVASCSCDDSSDRLLSSKQWRETNGKIKVLSTTAMIDDIVKQVGGPHVDSSTLIVGELDPHSYQLVKGDDEKLAFADIIFFNGLGLEHGPSLQSYLSNHSKAISLGDKIRQSDPTLILNFKGQVDPHIWMDISLWSQAIPYIVEVLSSKDPAHAEDYRANGELSINKMLEVHENIKRELQQLSSSTRYLVTSHDAFNYFARAYLADDKEIPTAWQERFAAPEGLAPDSQLSATDIQGIVDHMQRYRIRVLFPESNVSKDSIRKIVQAANEKGLKVEIANDHLYADAMGKPGTDSDTYLKMVQHNAMVIAKNLKLNNDG